MVWRLLYWGAAGEFHRVRVVRRGAKGQAESHMWTRATRWVVAALIGSAMTTVGCTHSRAVDEPTQVPRPIVADDSVVYAFETRLETRLVDRLELDNFLRERHIEIEVIDGVVTITGEVWTPLEKQRAGDLVRHAAGVVDVANHLDVRPPD